MEKVIITSIYDEIIEYYTNNTFDDLEEEDIKSKKEHLEEFDIDINHDSYEEKANNSKDNNSDIRYEISDDLMEDDVYMNRRFAYFKHKSLDQKENDMETIRNYLTKHFSYLMKNVFYVDMEKYKAGRSFFIYKKDAEIFRVILLRSVSQNQHDIIIRKWLEGKIRRDDYHAIVELCHRLFVLIENTNADSEVKNQWIEALSIALRIDFAYTMTEIEFTLKDIFINNSLPFKVQNTETPKNNESEDSSICHAYFSKSIIAELDTEDFSAYSSKMSILCEYLKTADFDKMKETESFPPVELLKMKSVCEMLYQEEDTDSPFPNADMIKKYGDYFASIDKEFQKKIEERKKNDKERHQRNKNKKKA